jgi:LuxR family quorum-sensing transcriptional regulator LasR
LKTLGTGAGEHASAHLTLAEIAGSVRKAADAAEIQTLLHIATASLGAERSFFANKSGEGRDACYTFVLDCDPIWWHRYRAACSVNDDPLLAYALKHSAPILSSGLQSVSQAPQRALDEAAEAGFRSAALVPAHSGNADGHVSLLCLGHSMAGYFEDPFIPNLLVLARSFALELQDWWICRERERLSHLARLSSSDLALLRRHCAGLTSKQIAREMQVSYESINSRFQRMTTKLGVHSRRAAARVAIECGLLSD